MPEGLLLAGGLGAVLLSVLAFVRLDALVSLGAGFTGAALLGWAVIPLLRSLKIRQVIQTDGPQTHQVKGGTPTMGGLFWVPPALVLPLFWVQTPRVWAVLALTLAYGLVGFWDDWRVITSRPGGPRGIPPWLKMSLLLAFGTIFVVYLFKTGYTPVVRGWADEGWLPLGLLFWPLGLFVLTGTSNAVNLTDGMDGLAAGTGAVACVALGLVVPADLALLCWVMAGCCLGFLVHNHKPARVFMGDTGSLALGGFLGAVSLVSAQLLPFLVMGGVFVLEALSVLIQVYYYKATKGPDGKGKRFFRMAPVHYHLELSGWPEIHVVALFYGLALVLAALAVWLRRL
ncbi:phospho-N-acetylmuramoyl-pentapeptide-transferase [Anthocerotibacter panamensis]|uniref:phospho-N-acetylmuramoyl-pentapeptide- transferase n=1 Tax=Anthocerotibacter panamensis TaxID=2857077 RepID=UPI001C407774|nr:phospho-N-acetylmuramoyl-pentapeptide-transferase [Anthocerotibacter panamensis]